MINSIQKKKKSREELPFFPLFFFRARSFRKESSMKRRTPRMEVCVCVATPVIIVRAVNNVARPVRSESRLISPARVA